MSSSNVFFKQSLTSGKAGEFRARCSMKKPHPISDLPLYLQREYEEKGWAKGYRDVRVRGHEVRKECFLEPLCDGFETTDREAFEHHMKVVHGKRGVTGANSALVNAAKGKWRTPSAPAEDRPFKLPKATADLVETCPSCGLVGEVVTNADHLWWTEHLRGCAIAVESVAS